VKSVLDTASFSQVVVVSRTPKEIKEIQNLETVHIDVFCHQTASKVLDRANVLRDMQLEVGLIQKVGFLNGVLNQTKIDAISELVEEVHALLWQTLTGVLHGRPVDVDINYEPAPDFWSDGIYPVLLTAKFVWKTQVVS